MTGRLSDELSMDCLSSQRGSAALLMILLAGISFVVATRFNRAKFSSRYNEIKIRDVSDHQRLERFFETYLNCPSYSEALSCNDLEGAHGIGDLRRHGSRYFRIGEIGIYEVYVDCNRQKWIRDVKYRRQKAEKWYFLRLDKCFTVSQGSPGNKAKGTSHYRER